MLGIKLIPYISGFLFVATLIWFIAFPLGGIVHVKLKKERKK